MATKFDIRQSISHDVLDQIASAAGKEVDDILRAINSELTVPLRLTASSPADMVLHFGALSVANPETARNRIIPPISNTLPTFTSGTVTLSGTGGAGVATPSAGSVFNFVMAANQYLKIGMHLDATGNIVMVAGTPAGTLAGASAPPIASNTYAIGYLVVRTNGANAIQTVTSSDIYQYIGGGAGGSGTGNANTILESIKNMMVDSPYELATPNIFAQSAATLIDGSSTGSYSLVNQTYALDPSEFMLSTQMADSQEFLSDSLDIASVDVVVFWKTGAVDTAATCQVSRDGDNAHFATLTMNRIGNSSETFVGSYTWPREEEDPYSDSFATTSTTAVLTDVAGTKEAAAQEFVLTGDPKRITAVGLQLSKSGSPAGSYRITLQTDNSGLPSGSILASGSWALCSTLGTSAALVSLSGLSVAALAGTYHVVVETDAVYKAGYTSNNADQIRIHGANSGTPVGSYYDGGVWLAESVNKYAYSVSAGVESYAVVNTFADAAGDFYYALNPISQSRLGQPFTTTAASVIKRAVLYMEKAGSPAGNVYVSIVRDDTGSPGQPSTNGADVLAMSNAVPISGITGSSPIVVTVDLPHTPLAAGTYHLVVSTDDAYKASWVSSTTELRLHTDSSSPAVATAHRYDTGTGWQNTTVAMTYVLSGRLLDLRVKITASAGGSLDAYAIFYKLQDAGPVGGLKKVEVRSFNSVTDNLSTFTLGTFLPDPDLIKVYHVETGQVYRYGAFTLQGYSVVFPANTFYNNGVSTTVTLRFEQLEGTSFDNADQNAALLAENHLGSLTGSLDRSIAGRGINLRADDGQLCELAIEKIGGVYVPVIYTIS